MTSAEYTDYKGAYESREMGDACVCVRVDKGTRQPGNL